MEESNLAIDANNLCKSFSGVPTVKNVSLKVKRGEIFGFLGPNGSGKTTVLRMLCGLLTPDDGYGTCLGYDIRTETANIKKHMGYIPQFFSLYKQLTVYQNIRLAAELYGVANRAERIEVVMHQLELNSHRNQISGTLSGGWKQRLALAAAIIHNPLLLLLDEPTANVDPDSRQNFLKLMRHLSSEGITILLCSHNMDEVERCHRVAYICDGEMIMAGKISEIINRVNLSTWQVRGDNVVALEKQLENTPGIDQVIIHFDSLHVSSKDPVALEHAIKPFRDNSDFSWKKIEPVLDDAFIWLTKSHRKSSD